MDKVFGALTRRIKEFDLSYSAGHDEFTLVHKDQNLRVRADFKRVLVEIEGRVTTFPVTREFFDSLRVEFDRRTDREQKEAVSLLNRWMKNKPLEKQS